MPAKNPIFKALMEELIEIHDKKSADYADDDNVYSNFEFAAFFAGVTVEQAFDVLLGVKQARKLQLQKGKVPLNEPLLDSYKDFTVYSGLRTSYYIKKQQGITETNDENR